MAVTRAPSDPKRLAILLSFSGAGGVEHMVMNLVREFAARGQSLDLLTIRDASAHFTDLPANVRWIPLKSRHALSAIPEIARYLKREHPAALLAAKDRAGRAALFARRLAGTATPVVIRLGTNLSTALQSRNVLQRWLRLAPMRLIYRQVDRIIAVSQGVAEDTQRVTGLPASRILVVRNPVVSPALAEKAAAPIPHPWLEEKERLRIPVIIAAGRLTTQKGFDILLRAFAILSKRRETRLLVLGEGGHRGMLLRLAQELEIADRVDLPGFQSNPYAWIARADLFVLSSRWEGSPNVLTEALALGIPSVATDCPSGPSEILDHGRYGPLIPVDDFAALAAAMQDTLDAPLPAQTLREAVKDYNVSRSADHYLQVLGLAPDGTLNAAF